MNVSTNRKNTKFVSFGLALLGLCTIVVLMLGHKSTALAKLRMPGVAKITLSKPGAYEIWYIYRWANKNIDSGYQDDIVGPTVVNCASGHGVPVQHCTKGNHIGFSFDKGEGEVLWKVHIAKPGAYELSMLPTKKRGPYLISVVDEEKHGMDLGSNYVFDGLLSDY
jgi:hypothetical protein